MKLEGEIQIKASTETVYRYITTPELMKLWVEDHIDLVLLNSKTLTKGTKFIQLVLDGRSIAKYYGEVLSDVSGKHATVKLWNDFLDFLLSVDLTESDDKKSCTTKYRFEVKLRTTSAKLVSPLIKLSLRKTLEKELKDIKSVVEFANP